MDDHTLRVLEFPKVLAMLAGETAFSVGHELALQLRPATELAGARRLQQETAEMRLLDQMGIDISFAAARDIREAAHAASIERTLDAGELLETAGALRTAWRAHQVIERVRNLAPALGEIADGVADLRRFCDDVEQAITAKAEVADSASEHLGSVRRELRQARDRLEQRAQAALADAIRRGLVQEGLLTERNGRKVIPIRAENRGSLPGIVHDVSSSGATVFLEPMAVVEAGNQVRELQLAEEREVRRVLQKLTAVLGGRAEEAEQTIIALGRLDLVHARVRLGRKLKAGLPPPGDADSWLFDSGQLRLVRARHPLLREPIVPTDFEVGGDYSGVLITGPNTGGKTVALKTVGLLTLMAQAGLPVPCYDTSRLRVFSQVYADIGDEQSIEQSLSTFSSHMRNVKAILDKAAPDTLVLLDELGAGTDPAEGSALARAIIEMLLEAGTTIVATTHHGELKAFAHSDERLRNASVEFDLETLSPTYHLTIGLPGQSNALAIARRLGIGEDVLERAQSQLAPGHFELEGLLAEIRDERKAAVAAHTEAEEAARAIVELRLELARRTEQIEEERATVLGEAHRAAESELAAVRRDVDSYRRRGTKRDYDAQAADETLRALDSRLASLKGQAKPKRAVTPEAVAAVRDLQTGDRVYVRDMPKAGDALGPIGEDGRVDVQFGSIRMKVSVDRVERVEPPAGVRARVIMPEQRPSAPIELDLRGKRAEEALMEFEGYLDDAFRAGLPFVRIIHGKGTGALRAAVREALREHPLVRRFESAPPEQGGEGVTVAILAG
ncbi:MAG: endonuclease MutS2 [Dehalococcoidia bacterium]